MVIDANRPVAFNASRVSRILRRSNSSFSDQAMTPFDHGFVHRLRAVDRCRTEPGDRTDIHGEVGRQRARGMVHDKVGLLHHRQRVAAPRQPVEDAPLRGNETFRPRPAAFLSGRAPCFRYRRRSSAWARGRAASTLTAADLIALARLHGNPYFRTRALLTGAFIALAACRTDRSRLPENRGRPRRSRRTSVPLIVAFRPQDLPQPLHVAVRPPPQGR